MCMCVKCQGSSKHFTQVRNPLPAIPTVKRFPQPMWQHALPLGYYSACVLLLSHVLNRSACFTQKLMLLLTGCCPSLMGYYTNRAYGLHYLSKLQKVLEPPPSGLQSCAGEQASVTEHSDTELARIAAVGEWRSLGLCSQTTGVCVLALL